MKNLATTKDIYNSVTMKELAHAGWIRLAKVDYGIQGGIWYLLSVDHWALPGDMTDNDLFDFFGNEDRQQDHMHVEALLHWVYRTREQAGRMFTMAVLKWGTREREQGVF